MALRIKEIAKKKGITMGEVAEQLGIHQVTLSASLNGNPTLARLEEVANVLGVEVSELFEKSPKKSISGFVDYDGDIYKIEEVDDLERLLNRIKKAK